MDISNDTETVTAQDTVGSSSGQLHTSDCIVWNISSYVHKPRKRSHKDLNTDVHSSIVHTPPMEWVDKMCQYAACLPSGPSGEASACPASELPGTSPEVTLPPESKVVVTGQARKKSKPCQAVVAKAAKAHILLPLRLAVGNLVTRRTEEEWQRVQSSSGPT
ncbi:hypothetical protein STEG23_032520 [Scotinomys teguina]